MKKAVPLSEYEDRLVTRMGGWVPGKRVVFRGLDLHRDFADADWMDLYVYGFSGRRLTRPQLKMLESLWIYTSYPDPRLWNNRIAALAGTARSTGALGISAALAVSDGTIYGAGPGTRAIDFLFRAKRRMVNGESLLSIVKQELNKQRIIPGYGRPITGVDERIPHLMKRAAQLGFDDGVYVKLAFDIERVLQAGRWRL